MDKIEVAGYSAAAACLLGTLAVFFLWIMPMNKQIKSNLADISKASGDLRRQIDGFGSIATIDPKSVDSVEKIEGLGDQLLVTDAVLKLARDNRKYIADMSHALIKSVVAGHEVKPVEVPHDKIHDLLAKRAELKKLFEDNKVALPAWGAIGWPGESDVTISDNQYISAMTSLDVFKALFKASTKVTLQRGVAEGDTISLKPLAAPLDEKVSQVLDFRYLDKGAWEARMKASNDEVARVTRTAPSKEAAANTSNPLAGDRTGFHLTFQTLSVNVGAALASLENLNGNLVTVKRLEVMRASPAFYTKANYNGETIPVPQPYRDGNVVVTVEVEMLGFHTSPKASEELEKKVWVDASTK